MGNNDTSNIVGIGDICLETNMGCKLVLKDVRHVPDLHLNLISPRKLDEEGFDKRFSNGCWKPTIRRAHLWLQEERSVVHFTRYKGSYASLK